MSKKRAVLNQNVQFQRVYRTGKSFISPLIVSYITPRKRGGIRYGITASKKVGCAAKRNRARRVIKAAVLTLLPLTSGSYDLVFVARKATTDAKSTTVFGILCNHLRKAGVIVDEASFLSCRLKKQIINND